MILPGNKASLIRKIRQLVDDCSISMQDRANLCATLKQWQYTGSPDGDTAIYNRLESHIDRMSSYLYSPVDLRFQMEFEHEYPERILKMGEEAGRYLSKKLEAADIDLTFGEGVDEALVNGSSVLKLMWGHDGLKSRLIPQYAFGVYKEDLNGLDKQEVLLETTHITTYELWRRISHLPDAMDMYKRAKNHAKSAPNTEESNYFHSLVLSGAGNVVSTDGNGLGPGGSVNVDVNSVSASISPEARLSLITFHELTILDDQAEDYTTVQFVEPDILITPRGKKQNLFVKGEHPYVLIQPNRASRYTWGRSELAPMLKLQALLRDRMEDIKKIMGLQYDRLLAFIGFSSMNDDMYDAFKENGYISQETPGAKVEDLTPKLPDAAFADINEILRFLDDVSGFQNILSGQGEAGVRSANHAQTLMKTASPRMRDRASIVERQCAEMGNKAFNLLRVKEAQTLWYGTGEDEKEEFLLSAIPDDYRVVVDSHSSSPIYEQDHQQMAMLLMKAGIIEGDSVIDLMQSLPMRDLLKSRYKLIQAKKAQMIKDHPELLTKGRSSRK